MNTIQATREERASTADASLPKRPAFTSPSLPLQIQQLQCDRVERARDRALAKPIDPKPKRPTTRSRLSESEVAADPQAIEPKYTAEL